MSNSYSAKVATYRFSDFFVISNALTYTGVELGLTEISTRTTEWAVLYQYEDDYFFVYSTTENGTTALQINLSSSFVCRASLCSRQAL